MRYHHIVIYTFSVIRILPSSILCYRQQKSTSTRRLASSKRRLSFSSEEESSFDSSEPESPDTPQPPDRHLFKSASNKHLAEPVVEKYFIPRKQVNTTESGIVLEDIVLPSIDQALREEHIPTVKSSAQPRLLVEEEITEEFIDPQQLKPSSTQPKITTTVSVKHTKDEVTDTDDLDLGFRESVSNNLSDQNKAYVIKTYTCQPINKMDVREALVGTNKKFECQVIGFPPPTIRWFKDNIEITHDPRYHFSHNHEDGVVSMHIETVSLADAGLYQCRAENCEGYAITAAHLLVKGW